MIREVARVRAGHVVSANGGKVHLRDIDQTVHRPDCVRHGMWGTTFVTTTDPLTCARCIQQHGWDLDSARRCQPADIRAVAVRELRDLAASLRKDLAHMVAYDLAVTGAAEAGYEAGVLARQMTTLATVLDQRAEELARRCVVELYEDNAGGLSLVHRDEAWALPGDVEHQSGFADDALSWLDGSWHPRDNDGAVQVDVVGLRAQTELSSDATVLVAVFEDGVVYPVGMAGAATEQYVSYGACGGTRQCSLNDTCSRRNPLGEQTCR